DNGELHALVEARVLKAAPDQAASWPDHGGVVGDFKLAFLAVFGRDGQSALLVIDFLHFPFDPTFDGSRAILSGLLSIAPQRNDHRNRCAQEGDKNALSHDCYSPGYNWRGKRNPPRADPPTPCSAIVRGTEPYLSKPELVCR